MRKRSQLVFVLLFGLSVITSAQPRKKSVSQYVHQVWQTQDGLPQNSVTAIAQTADGYMWLGTRAGLVRFDGVEFEIFNSKNTKALTNNDIWALRATSDGTLWIGTNGGGLIRFKDGQFRRQTVRESLFTDVIWTIQENWKGDLWVGSAGGGLNRLQDDTVKVYSTNQGMSSNFIWAVHEDRNGNVWVGTDGAGVNRIKDTTITHYSTENGFPGDYVFAIYEDRAGSLWFGTGGEGIVQFKNGKYHAYTTNDGLPSNIIWSIFEDEKGNLWVGTDGGLAVGKNGRFKEIAPEGLRGNSVSSIFQDGEDNIWVGTRGDGLHRFHEGLVASFTHEDGLSHNFVYAIYGDRDGTLWSGTNTGGLNRWKDGKFKSFSLKEGLSHNIVLSITRSADGSLWLGTDGGGLNRMREGVMSVYTTAQGLSSNTIWSLLEDRSGTLWIGTDGAGIDVLSKGKFKHIGLEEGLSGEFISAICQDSSGSIWIGTRDAAGVNRITDGRIAVYTTADGLADNNVWSIYEDGERCLWFATSGGLSRLKEGKFISYFETDGLFSNVVYGILRDDGGLIWLSTDKGILAMRVKDLDDFDDGKIKTIPCRTYGVSEGMRSAECNGGSPSAWKTPDGVLWFPTIKGMVAVDPTDLRKNDRVPPVRIKRVTINGIKHDALDARMDIPPGPVNLEFNYAALSFVAPEQVMFQYMLEGYEAKWIDAGARKSAFYTNIPPGEYTFRVKACNNDGVWNEQGQEFEFSVEPHFYQTTLFFVLCGLSLATAGFSAYYMRVRQLLRHEKELTAAVEEALARVKVLGGLIPICASCKKIRDDQGYWNQLEHYLKIHSEATFSHGICPECAEKLYGEYMKDGRVRSPRSQAGADTALPPVNP